MSRTGTDRARTIMDRPEIGNSTARNAQPRSFRVSLRRSPHSPLSRGLAEAPMTAQRGSLGSSSRAAPGRRAEIPPECRRRLVWDAQGRKEGCPKCMPAVQRSAPVPGDAGRVRWISRREHATKRAGDRTAGSGCPLHLQCALGACTSLAWWRLHPLEFEGERRRSGGAHGGSSHSDLCPPLYSTSPKTYAAQSSTLVSRKLCVQGPKSTSMICRTHDSGNNGSRTCP
ncbi:uncharacterized protein B0H18DRAFT_328810 [Fomitopsis serialis]|uniref:uncharacterized protein n=1 Tax=Fomitopsis serialis TaxID=139415 RepID=UPI0020088EF3|nr:uncharacterized protein B0H18DRAFT_328810 [Neoantrodia serialis]KAH9936659.1 hypothetical protein B0H18DRAFT_328810 [Neoantrodia serialis]